MSLASRIANLFLPDQSPQLVPSDGRATIAAIDGTNRTPEPPFGNHSESQRKENWLMEEEEEEGRPPYVHVSRLSTIVFFEVDYYLLISMLVYDSWWSWGYNR